VSDFDSFWTQYPRRESRAAAMREYIHARRMVTADAIMAGLVRYLEHLPRERQYIKKPASWLRDGDWDNEYDEPVVRERYPECTHTPKCNSHEWCRAVRLREQAS
jgi:hypothetical protein